MDPPRIGRRRAGAPGRGSAPNDFFNGLPARVRDEGPRYHPRAVRAHERPAPDMFDPATVVIGTLLASLALFLSDTLRYDVVALLVVLVLITTGALTPEEGFAGFASEPVIVIACLGLFGHALSRWGVGEFLCQRLIGGEQMGEAGLVLRQ
jgi:hypothetical protein